MKIIEGKQYTPEWWAARRGVPSASEFSSIITAVKGELSKSALDYACQLIADRFDPKYGEIEGFVSAAMKNGSQLEPEARAWYEMQHDCDIRQVCLCVTDDGKACCSPDGLVGDDGVLELKSPTHKTHVRWLLDGTLPDDYKQQVHGQLVVTGRAWAEFMSYVPGLPPMLVRVVPGEYTEKLRAALDQFWTLYQATLAKLSL